MALEGNIFADLEPATHGQAAPQTTFQVAPQEDPGNIFADLPQASEPQAAQPKEPAPVARRTSEPERAKAQPDYGYGDRVDGTSKGLGYFGEIQRPDGDVSTELSIGVEFDGKETQIPLIVPSLTRQEIDRLMKGDEPTEAMVRKAVDHARSRMREGKSPFAGPGEQQSLPQAEAEDSWRDVALQTGDAFFRAHRSVFPSLKAGIGGLVQSIGEMPYYIPPEREEEIYREAARRKISPQQVMHELGIEAPKESVPARIAQAGEGIYRDAQAELEALAPNVEKRSFPWYLYQFTRVMGEMAPSVALSLATRRPVLGATQIGAHVGGLQYGESRNERGRTPEQARTDAMFYGASELLTERVPLGILAKEGLTLSSRIAKAGVAEGIQEFLTESLQIGYDTGVFGDEMTLGEAVRRVIDAVVLGTAAGSSMAVVVEPFHRMRQRKATEGAQTEAGVPEGAVSADVLYGQSEATGAREQARAETPPPSPEDEASPIPTDLIEQGRETIADATGARSAAQILEQGGFPPIESRVTFTTDTGGQLSGTVIDAFDENGRQGAKIRLDYGRVVTATFEELQGRVALEGQEAQPTPTVASVVAEDIERHWKTAQRIGVAEEIERLAYEGKTADQIVIALGGKLEIYDRLARANQEGPGQASLDKGNMVRAVRLKLGIPSLDERAEFDTWRRDYEQRRAAPGTQKEQPDAKAVRGDTGQVETPGQERPAGEVPGGPNLQQPTSAGATPGEQPAQGGAAQPQQGIAPQEGIAPAAEPVRKPIPRREAEPDTAVTAAGREVPVRYAVVEAADLQASQLDDGRVNPDYPAELQPRDRARAVSAQQIRDIAQNLNPRLLGRSPRASDGAPIIADDGVIESGNGRVLAIRRAYAEGGAGAKRYRDYLAEQGFSVEGMTAPVLVRVRAGEMEASERQAFTREANERDTLGVSATERALSDAQALPDALLELYRGGEVDAAANRDFVRAFIERVVGRNEQAGMIGADGAISQEAIRRIQAALLAKAYGDADLLANLVESADTNIKAIGGALMDVAPDWARLRADASAGIIDPAMDQTARLLEAVRLVQQARREGRSLAELVGQRDILSGDALHPVAELFLRLMFRNTRNWTRPAGREKLTQALRDYTQTAATARAGIDLLGDSAPTPERILESVRERQYGRDEGQEQQDLLAQSAGGAGERPRADGEGGAQRSGSGAPPAGGEEGAGARPGGAAAEEVAPAGPSELGANADGQTVFQDPNGRRYIEISGTRLYEPTGTRPDQYKIAAELGGASPAAQQPATTPATPSVEPPLRIEDYTEKSIIVKGKTQAHMERIKGALANRHPLWNAKAKGWVFPKAREAEVRAALADLLGAAPTAEEPNQGGRPSGQFGEGPSQSQLSRTMDLYKGVDIEVLKPRYMEVRFTPSSGEPVEVRIAKDEPEDEYVSPHLELTSGEEDVKTTPGIATRLYLAALHYAATHNVGWASDPIRSDRTEAMYQRLMAAGVPFQYGETPDDKSLHSKFHLSAEALRKVNLADVAESLRKRYEAGGSGRAEASAPDPIAQAIERANAEIPEGFEIRDEGQSLALYRDGARTGITGINRTESGVEEILRQLQRLRSPETPSAPQRAPRFRKTEELIEQIKQIAARGELERSPEAIKIMAELDRRLGDGMEALNEELDLIEDPIVQRPRRGDRTQRGIFDQRIEDIDDPADLRAYAEQLRTALMTDERTGLGSNRAWITRKPKAFTASIDLDSLKWVNDHMGHDAGDRLIAAVGEALRHAGIADDAFHVSGDEFYAQAESESDLRATLEGAREHLRGVTISGRGLSYTGPGFSYGIGSNIEQAERGLHGEKSRREEAGERAARGERPQGVVGTAQAQEQERAPGDREEAAETRPGEGAERPGSDVALAQDDLLGETSPQARRSLETLRDDPNAPRLSGKLTDGRDAAGNTRPDWRPVGKGFEARAYVWNGTAIQEVRSPSGAVARRGMGSKGRPFAELEASATLEDVLSGVAFEEFQRYFDVQPALAAPTPPQPQPEETPRQKLDRMQAELLELYQERDAQPMVTDDRLERTIRNYEKVIEELRAQLGIAPKTPPKSGDTLPEEEARANYRRQQEIMAQLPRDIGKIWQQGRQLSPAKQALYDELQELLKVLPQTSEQWQRFWRESRADYETKRAEAADKRRAEGLERARKAGFAEGDTVELYSAPMILGGPATHLIGTVKVAKDGVVYVMAKDRFQPGAPAQRLDLFANPWTRIGSGKPGAPSTTKNEASEDATADEFDEIFDAALDEQFGPSEAPTGEEGAPEEGAAQSDTERLARAFAAEFRAGRRFASIVEARTLAEQVLGRSVRPGSPEAKALEEAIEAGIVLRAREIAGEGRPAGETYDRLVALYAAQPLLAERTSSSIERQAYSTPAPLAYLASRLAGIGPNTRVYEPTAGNGMLLMEARPENITANEINAERAENLHMILGEAATLTQRDAIEFTPEGTFEAVITNPPFGKVREGNKNRMFDIDGLATAEVDHGIAWSALQSMLADGRAVLIIGSKKGDAQARLKGYRSFKTMAFMRKLYDNYNVVDHFTVDGHLYERQGAGWPVDVIVIDGRGRSALSLPTRQPPPVLTSWDELRGKLNGRDRLDTAGQLPGPGNRPAAGTTEAGAEPTGVPIRTGRADRPDDQAGGTGERPKAPAGRGGHGEPGGGRKPRGRGGTARGEQSVAPGAGGVPAGAGASTPEARPPGEASPGGRDPGGVSRNPVPRQPLEERPASEAATSAASNIAMGLDEVASGLAELFGGHGRLSSGLTFDEDTYAKAKPYFIAGVKHFQAAGRDIGDMVKALVRHLAEGARMPRTAIEAMRPYIRRFVEDVRAGRIRLDERQDTQPQPPRTSARRENTEAETEFQIRYEPTSKARFAVGTVVPRNMQTAMSRALAQLSSRVGDIDQYVAGKLGYSLDELLGTEQRPGYFSAEQVDALALAIDNVEGGGAFIVGDQTGVGKGRAQPLDEPVLTPSGWRPIGELKVGDLVIAADGSATRVSGVYPQGEQAVYRITFKDGAATRCTADHLWAFQTRNHRHYAKNGTGDWGRFRVARTEEIAVRLEEIISIPLTGPVAMPGQPVPLSPYLVGAILGDAHIKPTGQVQIVIGEEEMATLVDAELPEPLRLVYRGRHHYDITKGHRCAPQKNAVVDAMKALAMAGVGAAEKRVPQVYLWNDIETRHAVLQGLLDTDGTAQKNGSVIFYSVSSQLACDVEFLVRSLGGLTTRGVKPTTHRDCHVVYVKLPDCFAPFRLPRKAARVKPWDKYVPTRYVEEIEKIGTAPCQCIAIEHPSRLYLTRDFIVTHNTCAAMLRYGLQNDKTPVFVTKDPALYADMVRDLRDIGMLDIASRILVTNNDLRGKDAVPLSDDASDVLTALPSLKQKAAIRQIASSGNLPEGFDMLFTTYPQMQYAPGGEMIDRQSALLSLAPNSIVVLDESHEAGGTETRKINPKTGEPMPTRADFIRQVLQETQGAVYSSATYAKNPTVMSLYFKTDLSMAVERLEELAETIRAGGVPLQQVVANMLVEAGQYARRERSFEGVEMNLDVLPTDLKQASRSAETLRAVFTLDADYMEGARIGFINEMESQGEKGGRDAAVGESSAGQTGFAQVMHNVISQMLLSLKAPAVVDQAIALARAGEKPIIALSNTNESILKDFIADEQLNPGDRADLTFNVILNRYLRRLRRITLKDADGNKRHLFMTDAQIREFGGVDALNQYKAVERAIAEADLSTMPASPVDYILDRLNAAGVKADEITGRGVMIRNGVYQTRKASPAEKKKVMNAYNAGRLDALVINRSGSTGFSMHATDKPGNDGKPRHMIVLQPDSNIDVFMQMLGRIHRTGQIRLPRYTLGVSDLSVEKRLAAVLMRKMASLNANTTASKRSAVSLDNVTDFMNKYGDEVVAEFLRENTELENLTNVHPGGMIEGIAAKFTGRLAILDPDQVTQIYEQIERSYRDYIEALDRMGMNALEAKTLDLDARTIATQPLAEARAGGSDSPFAEAAVIETVSARKLGKPYTEEELQAEIQAAYGEQTDRAQYITEQFAEIDAKMPGYQAHIEDGIQRATKALQEAKTAKQEERAQSALANWQRTLEEAERKLREIKKRVAEYLPGSAHILTIRQGEQEQSVYAVALGVDIRAVRDNPTAASTYKVRFAIADAGREIRVPLSKFMGEEPPYATVLEDFDATLIAFREGGQETRETRQIITGNLVSGYAKFKRGQIVMFTDDQGQTRQGILMPREFDAQRELDRLPVPFETAEQVARFLMDEPGQRIVKTEDGIANITFNDEGFQIAVNVRGGKPYYLNQAVRALIGEFQSRRGQKVMRATIGGSQSLAQVLDIYRENLDARFVATAHKDEARAIVGEGNAAAEPAVTYNELATPIDPESVHAPPTRYQVRARRGADRDDPAERDTLQGELDLFTPEDTPPAQLPPSVRAVTTGQFATGIERVTTPEQAAHVLAPLRKQAQENVLALVTDAQGRPLAVLRHSIGGVAEAAVHIAPLVGAVHSVPGAASVWFAHNHPSGQARQSEADIHITRKLHAVLEGTGIEPKGMIVVAPGGAASFFDAHPASSSSYHLKPAARARRKGTVAVQERAIRRVAKPLGESITAPLDMIDFMAARPERNAVLLLNNRNQPIAFIPMGPAVMGRLRTGATTGGASRLLREINGHNAAALAVKTEDAEAGRNVLDFARDHDLTALDVIVDGKSLSAEGKSLSNNRAFFALRGESSGITLEFARDAKRITANLAARLKQLGISEKVALRLRERIQAVVDGKASEADGRYLRGVIEVSLSAQDGLRTLNHEVIHALRDLGLIREAEWRALSRAAKADTARMARVRARYTRLGLSEEALIEEAVAEMHADWAGARRPAAGFVRRAFERIRDFLRALGRVLTGRGYHSAESVFRAIERGEVGARQPRDAQGRFVSPERPRFSTDTSASRRKQTETPEFKRWFGDWEIRAINQNLRDVTGSEAAKRAARTFLNKPLHNKDSGIKATVSGVALAKMLSKSAREQSYSVQAHMKAVANLDKLFPLALLRMTRRDRDGGTDIEAIHHFDVPMVFGGRVLRVKIMAKAFYDEAKGTRLYLVQAVEIDAGVVGKEPGVSGQSRRAMGASSPPPSVSERFAQMMAAVKGEGVSKVVDANGEPLVVYHGTKSDVAEFQIGKAQRRDSGWLGDGFYLTGSQDLANSYAMREADHSLTERPANVMPVYVRLENPYRINLSGLSFDESRNFTRQFGGNEGFKQWLSENGYDGVIGYRDSEIAGQGAEHWEIVVFDPTQIKSATGNRGTFDATNPDIRYALRDEVTDPTAPGGAQARQHATSRWLGSQPIDQAMRLPFHLFGGFDASGRWNWGAKLSDKAAKLITEAKFDDAGRFVWLNPMIETARVGLIDRYGLEPAYVERERQRGLEERRIMAQVPEIMQRLKEGGIGAEEARVLHAVLTGEAVADADMERLAEPIRNAIDDMGAEAVQLGLLSAEAFERNRGAYLHRVYQKHETDQAKLARWISRLASRRRRKIIGNQFKGRGLWIEVDRGRLMRHVPGFTGAERGEAVIGERFRVLDLVEDEGQGTLRGIDPRSRRRVLDRRFLPEDAPVPENLAGYVERGVWEVRGTQRGKVVLWRDFTKPERESMGEIVDARYTIAKTYMGMAHDLATGRFFRDISLNEDWSTANEPPGAWKSAEEYNRFWADPEIEWVKVPDTDIKDTHTKRYGALAGRYVRAEIWRDLAELEAMQAPGWWNSLLTTWKLNKTSRSPVVHLNNVMSNAVLMDLADVRAVDLARGIRSMVRQDTDYQEALEHGTFGADMVAQEIRRDVLKPLLEEIEREIQGGQDSMQARFGLVGKLAGAIWSRAKNLDRKMLNLYQLEDEVFRMATYVRNRKRGMSPNEAALDARDQFLNYDIRAPWVNAARRSVMPFIAYTYRAIPVVARSVATRPWKLAKYATIAYVINALGYMLEPGDEDEERRSLREQETGLTWIGAPRMIRMPGSDSYGNPIFLDVRRWIPAGDVFDINQGHGAFPVPAPLQFGGPALLAFELILNKQAFTGEEIVNTRTDDWWDRSSKVGDWLWKSWMPSAAWIPGSWYYERIWNAATGVRDRQHRPYELAQAIPSAFGIKLKPQDVKEGFFWKGVEFDRIERELRAQMKSLDRDRESGKVSRESFERRKQRILGKFNDLNRERQRTFVGEER